MSPTSTTTQAVHSHYSALARESPSQNAAHIRKVAESFGYSPEDLAGIPEGANLGVSCGNPFAMAGIKPGETVIDLGSGAGFDVFQAARKVGPSGLSIGVDMSQDMLSRAQLNATKSNITNVRFVLSNITKIPLETESADCVISNCVINLLESDEKVVCFREVYRLLRKGGRLAVSDILAKKEMSGEMRGDLGLFVGCISGASLVEEYEGWLREAGFQDILIVDKHSDLNIYKERSQAGESSSSSGTNAEPASSASSCCAPAKEGSCCGSGSQEEKTAGQLNKEAAMRVEKIDFNEWVSSYSIYAVKPSA